MKGKIVIARRFVPEHEKLTTPEAQRRAGDLRKKAFVARSLGAKALVVVDLPVVVPSKDPHAAERSAAGGRAAHAPPRRHGRGGHSGDRGEARRAGAASGRTSRRRSASSSQLGVELAAQKTQAFNVVGKIPAGITLDKMQGAMVIGAHYDHLGMGGAELARARQRRSAPRRRRQRLGRRHPARDRAHARRPSSAARCATW